MARSIRLRLSRFYGGLLALALLVFCAAVYLVFRHRLYYDLEAQLRADAAGAMNLLLEEFFETEEDDDDPHEKKQQGLHVFEDIDLVATDVYLHLVGSDRTTLQLSPNLQEELLLGDLKALPTKPRMATVSHPRLGRLRQHVLPTRVGPETFWVGSAKSLAPIEAALRELLLLFAVFLPGTVALVGLGGYLLAGRALAPIDQVIAAARAIREGDLSRRIALSGPSDELKALADEFDTMIASLESLVEAERRFVADASHELRTPLAVIGSCVQVHLRERDASVEQMREALAVVRRETQTMTRLVEDLLTLARADASQEQLAFDIVPLAALVEEVRDALQWVHNGPTLRLEVPEELTVHGDGRRLSQLLRSLFENTFRHCPPPTTVSVTARVEGKWVHVEVADDGPGIAAEHLPHLFDRFYRVDKTRSREQGGSGLGLAICQWIAEGHEGRIEVDSTVGEGTTFTVVLPVGLSG